MKTASLKRNARVNAPMKALSVLTCWSLLFWPVLARGANLPTGANVAYGGVSIATSGNTMNITQTTGQAIVNWESFNIGLGSAVMVDQPSRYSAMLSRVVGGDPSQIMGLLEANGIFYLVNPSGVYFGKEAVVNVPELIVSTLNISDADFLAGKTKFTGDSLAALVNEGTINAEMAALIAGQGRVTNTGQINAADAFLAAGATVELGRIGGGRLAIDISGLAGEAVNAGTIATGDAGHVTVAGGRVGFDTGSVVDAGMDGTVRVHSEGITAMMPGSSIVAPGGDVRLNPPGADGSMAEGTRLLPGATINTRGGDTDGFIEVSGRAIEVGGANLQAGEILFDPDFIEFRIIDTSGFVPFQSAGESNVSGFPADLRMALTENMNTTSVFDVDGQNNITGWAPDGGGGWIPVTTAPVLRNANDGDIIRFEALLDIIVVDEFNVATATGSNNVNVEFSAGRDILLQADLELDGTGYFEGFAGRDITGGFRVQNDLGTGNISVSAGGGIDLFGLYTAGALDINAQEHITLAGIRSGTNAVVASNAGNISIASVNSAAGTAAGIEVVAPAGSATLGASNLGTPGTPLAALRVTARDTALLTTANLGAGGLHVVGSGNTTYINDITTAGGPVLIEDNVRLLSSSTIATSGGNVQILGRVDSLAPGRDFTINAGAGNILLGNSVGAIVPIHDLTLASTGTTELNHSIITERNVDFTGLRRIHMGSDLSVVASRGQVLFGTVGTTWLSGAHDLSIRADRDRGVVYAATIAEHSPIRSLHLFGGDLPVSVLAPVYTEGNVSIVNRASSVTIDSIIGAHGNITVQGGGSVTVTAGLQAGGDLHVHSMHRAVTLDPGLGVDASFRAQSALFSGESVVIDSPLVNETGSIRIEPTLTTIDLNANVTAQADLIFNGPTILGTDIVLTSASGDILLNGPVTAWPGNDYNLTVAAPVGSVVLHDIGWAGQPLPGIGEGLDAEMGALTVSSGVWTTLEGSIFTNGGVVDFTGSSDVRLGRDVLINTSNNEFNGAGADILFGSGNPLAMNMLSGGHGLWLDAGNDGNIRFDNVTELTALTYMDWELAGNYGANDVTWNLMAIPGPIAGTAAGTVTMGNTILNSNFFQTSPRIVINQPVVVSGNHTITLNATGVGIGIHDGDIIVGDLVMSSTGAITLNADDDIVFRNAGQIRTAGAVTLTAGLGDGGPTDGGTAYLRGIVDQGPLLSGNFARIIAGEANLDVVSSAGGLIGAATHADGAVIVPAAGSLRAKGASPIIVNASVLGTTGIDMTFLDDVLIGTIDADQGPVNLLTWGSMNDTVGELGDFNIDIFGSTIDLEAYHGIGNAAQLETSTSSLGAVARDGNIDLYNFPVAGTPTQVRRLRTDVGHINLGLAGSEQLVLSNVFAAKGDVYITNSNDILVNGFGVMASQGAARLGASGAILEGDGWGPYSISAADIELGANAGIGISGTPLRTHTSGSSIVVSSVGSYYGSNYTSHYTTLDAQVIGTGAIIEFRQFGDGDLEILRAQTEDGHIGAWVRDGNLIVNEVTAGGFGDVYLITSVSGDITLGTATAVGNTVFAVAGHVDIPPFTFSGMLDPAATGRIIDANGLAPNIYAGNAHLAARDGIDVDVQLTGTLIARTTNGLAILPGGPVDVFAYTGDSPTGTIDVISVDGGSAAVRLGSDGGINLAGGSVFSGSRIQLDAVGDIVGSPFLSTSIQGGGTASLIIDNARQVVSLLADVNDVTIHNAQTVIDLNLVGPTDIIKIRAAEEVDLVSFGDRLSIGEITAGGLITLLGRSDVTTVLEALPGTVSRITGERLETVQFRSVDLDTAVNEFTASVIGTANEPGSLTLRNAGDLVLDGLTAEIHAPVDISTTGNLLVQEAITTRGSGQTIALTATAGSVVVYEKDDELLATAVDVGGDADITITAGNDIVLHTGLLAEAATVNLTAGGAILDPTPGSGRIQAVTLRVLDADGIGRDGWASSPWDDQWLQTSIENLVIARNRTGDVFLTNDQALTITDVWSDGDVSIRTTAGGIAVSAISTSDDLIALQSAEGISVNWLGLVDAGRGPVRLTAEDGSITQEIAGTTITGGDIVLTANQGTIGTDLISLGTSTTASSITASTVGDDMDIWINNFTTADTSLAATTNGIGSDITFLQTLGGNLRVIEAATRQGGNIGIQVDNGSMIVDVVTAGTDPADAGWIFLAATTAGDIGLGLVTAWDDTVTIGAQGTIYDLNGLTNNISARNLELFGRDGIDTDIRIDGTLIASSTNATIDIFADAFYPGGPLGWNADGYLDVISIDAGLGQVFLAVDGSIDLTQGSIRSQTRTTLEARGNIFGNPFATTAIDGDGTGTLVVEKVDELYNILANVPDVWINEARTIANLRFTPGININVIRAAENVDLVADGDRMSIGEITAGGTVSLLGRADNTTVLNQLAGNDSYLRADRLRIVQFANVDLTTAVDELTLSVIGSAATPGMIAIANQGNLILDGITAQIYSPVVIATTGDMLVREAITTRGADQYIDLVSSAGSVIVREKDAETLQVAADAGGAADIAISAGDTIVLHTGLQAEAGTVTLNAGGAIVDPTRAFDAAADPTLELTGTITATTLRIEGATTVGNTDPDNIGNWQANRFALDTAIDQLIIAAADDRPATTGAVYILEADTLPHIYARVDGDLNVATVAGPIGLDGVGPIADLVDIVASNDAVVLTAAGAVTIDRIHTGAGRVALTALDGSILDRSSGAPNVIASDIVLRAFDGSIGTVGNWLDTQTTGSSITASTTGDNNDIFILNNALPTVQVDLRANTTGNNASIFFTQQGGGDLEVVSATTVDGNATITVNTGGDLFAAFMDINGALPLGNAFLTTVGGGNVTFGSVTADNLVQVRSSGQAFSQTSGLNLTANTIDVEAATDIIGLMISQLGDSPAASAVRLFALAGTIAGSNITAFDNVLLDAAGTNGSITNTLITTTGPNGAVLAYADAGFYAGNITSQQNAVRLYARGGDIVDMNITAQGLALMNAMFNGSIISGSATSTAGYVSLRADRTDAADLTAGNVLNVVANSFLGTSIVADGEVIGTIANVGNDDLFIIAPTVSGGEYVTLGNVIIKSTATAAGQGDVVGISVDAGGNVYVDTGAGGDKDVLGGMIDAGGNVAIGVQIDVDLTDPDLPIASIPTDASYGLFGDLIPGEAMNIIGTAINAGGWVLLNANAEIDGTHVTAVGDIDANAGTGIVNTSLVSVAGSITATTLLGNIVDSAFVTKGEGGTVTLEALAATGELDGNEVVAISDINVTAGGYIVDGMYVSETGDVTLTSLNQSIVGTNVVSKLGNATLNAGRFINAADITAMQNVFLNADADVANTTVLAGANITVDGYNNAQVRSLHTSTLVAGGNVVIDASEEVDGSTINALGSVNIAARNVTNSAVDADGLIDVDALMSITNSIFKGDLAGGTAVDLTALAGSINNVDVMATFGNALLTAGQDVVNTDVIAAGTIGYTVTRDVLNGSATAGGNITASVNGRMVNWLATTNGGDTILVQGLGGTAAGSIDGGVFTADTVTFNKAAGVGANDAVRIAGAETITIDNTVSGGVNVVSTNNNATIIDVDALGSGDIVFDQRGDGALTVANLNTEDGDIWLTSAAATTVISITSGTNGSIGVALSDGALEVAAAGTGIVADGSGNINLSTAAAGSTVGVENDIRLLQQLTSGTGVITVLSGANLEAEHNITTATTVNLGAKGAIVDTTDDTTNISANILNIVGATSVGSDADADPTTTDDGWLDTDVVQVNIANVDGSVFILEVDDIEMGKVTVDLAYDEHLALHSGGSITLGNVNAAAGTTTLVAADAINDAQDDDVIDITSRVVDLNAVNGIGETRPVELSAEWITADTTGLGAAMIQLANVSAVPTTVGSLTTVGTAANIAFTQMGAGDVSFTTVTTADGSITLQSIASDLAATTVTAGSLAAAIRDITIDAEQDIEINGDVTAVNGTILASAGRDIQQTAGQILAQAGGVGITAGRHVTVSDIEANANTVAGNTAAIKIDAAGVVTIEAGGPGLVAVDAIDELHISIDPTDVLISSNITASGNVFVTASNNILIDTNAVIRADSNANDLGDATIVADDDLSGAGRFEMAAGTAILAENIAIAGYNVVADTLTADVAGNVDAAGDLLGIGNVTVTAANHATFNGPVTAGNQTGTIAITGAEGSVTTNALATLTAGGNITSIAGIDTTIGAAVLSFNGAIDIDAGRDIVSNAAGTLTGPAGVTLTAGQDIDLAAFALSTGGDVTLLANEDVDTTAAATLTGQNVFVTGTTGNVNLAGDLTATTGNVEVVSGLDMSITGETLAQVDATFAAGRDMLLAGDVTATTGLIDAAALRNLTQTGDLDAATSIALAATDGAFASTGTALAGTSYDLFAGLNATIGGSVTAGTSIDVEVVLNDALVNAALLAGTTIDIDAGRDIVSNAAGTLTGPAGVTLTAGRDIDLAAFALSTGGDVTLLANEDVDTDAAATLTGQNVFVTGTTGEVTIGGDLTATDGEVEVVASEGSVMTTASIAATDEITIAAGTDVRLISPDANNPETIANTNDDADIRISAGRDIYTGVETYTEGLGSDIWVSAGRDLVGLLPTEGITGFEAEYGDITLLAGKDIVLGRGTDEYFDVYAWEGNVDVQAGEDLVLAGWTYIEGVNVNLLTGAHIFLADAADSSRKNKVEAYDNLAMTAGGNIYLGRHAQAVAGNDIDIWTGEDMLMSYDSLLQATSGKITSLSYGDFMMAAGALVSANGAVPVGGDLFKVDITAEGVVIDRIEALAAGAGIKIEATEHSITVHADDNEDDLLADLVHLQAVLGIGTNPIPASGSRLLAVAAPRMMLVNGGVAGAVDISGAENIYAITTGDNGGIYVDSENACPTTVRAFTLGEDADIIWNHSGPTCNPCAWLTLDFVATQNGDIVVFSETAVRANHVWALDGGTIDTSSPNLMRPSFAKDGVSMPANGNGITGEIDDAHFVWIESKSHIEVRDVRADYHIQINAIGDDCNKCPDVGIGAYGLVSGGSVEVQAYGNIYDLDNNAHTNIVAAKDITLLAGGRIGEPLAGDPLEVFAARNVNVGVINDAKCFGGFGQSSVWAFINGHSGSGDINYIGPGSTAPGLIIWNGTVVGGPSYPMQRFWREEMMHVYQMPLHLSNYLHDDLMYFPHSYMMLPTFPDHLPIELILHGGGSIDGLPEGVTPSEIDINELDDTLSWNWSTNQEDEVLLVGDGEL